MATVTGELHNGATRRAAEILHAWRSADRERLQAALASAAAIELSGDATECERAELLLGIVADMREALASGRTEGAEVCRQLLRHLAGPRPMAFYIN